MGYISLTADHISVANMLARELDGEELIEFFDALAEALDGDEDNAPQKLANRRLEPVSDTALTMLREMVKNAEACKLQK